MGHITTIPEATTFPLGPPKKICFSELGVIFWGSPLFLAVFGHSHFRGATTLNFGPISTKLGGTVRAIKKMTQKDNGPFFMGPKFQFLVQKSDFCQTTPILVNDPFLALGMTVNFPPWDRFFDFPFRSYSSFRKKNPVDPSKSLPRSPL